jgi:hypothetical protein
MSSPRLFETTNNTDIFLITSVIVTGINAWSYTNVRSTYTADERLQQTYETIASIRALCGETKIILAECSELPSEQEDELRSRVDMYFQLYGEPNIRRACLDSNKKGYGELLATQYIVRRLLEEKTPFLRLFKISGRYSLNDSFCRENFSKSAFTFREPFPQTANHPTVLYAVGYPCLPTFANAIEQVDRQFEDDTYEMYELCLPPRCQPMTVVSTCGVSGRVAVDGSLYIDA